MSNFIMGRKVGMSQVFNEDGIVVPITVVQVGPCTVVRKKEQEKDGYEALVVGFETGKERKTNSEQEKKGKRKGKVKGGLNKPEMGLFKKLDVAPKKYLKEFKVEDIKGFEIGQDIKVEDMFKDGDMVDVTGVSKGKGFQGPIKRHGQSRGRETHGSHYHRGVGSMGACSSPSRVFKGKKLPGHMGSEKVTVQNLDIVKVDSERCLLLIKGAIPGPKGGIVTVKSTVKSK